MLLYILIFSETQKDLTNHTNKVGKIHDYLALKKKKKKRFKLQGYVKDFNFMTFKLGQSIFPGYSDLANREKWF